MRHSRRPSVTVSDHPLSQDLVSRFTLDSATEFLFGKDLCSLSAGLPYPPNTPRARDHSHDSDLANRFARSFLQAQELSSRRSRYTKAWPLLEFWNNKVDEHVKVMDEFIGPLLNEALAKKSKQVEEKDEEVGEDETLLEHLVKLTDGMSFDLESLRLAALTTVCRSPDYSRRDLEYPACWP